MAENRAELLASLQKGEVRKGRVKNITDFGAFIDTCTRTATSIEACIT